ncbi:hypothetical protein KJ807_05615 [Patescibacteria group bacterium]|nr:hypothetical protein [Patescibacteria group bacterium]
MSAAEIVDTATTDEVVRGTCFKCVPETGKPRGVRQPFSPGFVKEEIKITKRKGKDLKKAVTRFRHIGQCSVCGQRMTSLLKSVQTEQAQE